MTRVIAAVLAAAVLAVLPAATAARQSDESDEARRVREAAVVFGEIMTAKTKRFRVHCSATPRGIAVFPGTVRAGFIFGGMRGRGILSARTESGWSPPAFLTLTGGSFGLQIGGQAVDLILVIEIDAASKTSSRTNSNWAPTRQWRPGPWGVKPRHRPTCSCARRF